MVNLGKATALLLGLCVFGTVQAGVVGSKLQEVLRTANASDEIPVIITLVDQVDVKVFKDKDKSLRRSKLVKELTKKSDESQKDLRKFLKDTAGIKDRDTIVLWNINSLAVTVAADIVGPLAARDDVAKVILDATVDIASDSHSGAPGGAAPEWNISATNAPDLWALGYDGSGVVVGVMDSGADPYHPDIAPSWRGGTNSWFDPNNQYATPNDNSGHGTQVTGLIVGGESGGTAIGIAPGAHWIAVKIFDSQGQAQLSRIHLGYQWFLDPDGDPNVDDVPDIVNNSWNLLNSVGTCDSEFAPDIAALKAAEIAIVFSGGNFGPGASSSPSPANDPQSLSVGAVDPSLNVAGFSSRGPSACDGGIFPRVSAPGMNIYTADLTYGGVFPNSYRFVEGTSFSAPHVAGSMAVLKNAMESQGYTVTVSQLETALLEGAIDMGAPGPDHDSGHGLLDVVGAYNWLLANVGSPQPGDLQFSASDYSVAEDAGSIIVTVDRTGGTAGDVTVDYATSDGSASAGSDYTNTTGTLTFLDGETSQTFSVPIVDDTDAESDETVNLTLSNVAGGASLGTPATAVLTITDNDLAGALHFSTAAYSAGEGDVSATITVTRTGGSAGQVSVDYATADGSANAGSDYASTSGTLTFVDGDASESFTVSITNDAVYELDEDLNLSLSNPTGGATLGSPASASLTILDDDPQPQPGQLQFSTAAYSGDEDAGNLSVTVTRTGGTDGTVTVDYDTADGTATAGSDYTSASGTLTFVDGDASESFTVTILDDAVDEADESLTVTLTNLTGGATMGSPSNAGLTIIDDDPPAGPADNDNDGYTSDVDCNDNDASVYPGAAEVKHDGIDQDCNGYDLTINITRAWYQVSKDKVIVWATSALGNQAALTVSIALDGGGTVNRTMTWKANKNRWQRVISRFQNKFGAAPVSVTVTGVEGVESSPIELR